MAYCLPGLCFCQMTVISQAVLPRVMSLFNPLAHTNGKNTNSFWTSISTQKIGPVLKAWTKHIIMRLYLTWKRNRGWSVCVCACASRAHQSCVWKQQDELTENSPQQINWMEMFAQRSILRTKHLPVRHNRCNYALGDLLNLTLTN